VVSFFALSFYDVLAMRSVAKEKVPDKIAGLAGASGNAISNLLELFYLKGRGARDMSFTDLGFELPEVRLLGSLSEGLCATSDRVTAVDGERIIRLVAHHVGAEVHAAAPRISAELPETGERFEGLLPPLVTAPTFAIRKPAIAVFTLGDYVSAGIISATQADALRTAVASRCNILVTGGTSTGKTALANALLAEVAKTEYRVVLIEDTLHIDAAVEDMRDRRRRGVCRPQSGRALADQPAPVVVSG
jgi:hypothetical protein